MGTWSTSLFGGDIACDIRENYVAYLKMGLSGRQATKQLLEDYDDELSDAVQDGPVVWLALAVVQWKYGRLEPKFKAKALKIIKSGGDLAAWEPQDQKRRRNVLDKVRKQLESPQPAEKAVRIVKPAKPLKKIEQLWTAGQVVAFRRDSGRFALLLTEGVTVQDYIGQIPYFVLLKWAGMKIPSSEKIRKLRIIKQLVGVMPNRKDPSIPWDRVQRLNVRRAPSGIAIIDAVGVLCETGFEECPWNELDSCIADAFDSNG